MQRQRRRQRSECRDTCTGLRNVDEAVPGHSDTHCLTRVCVCLPQPGEHFQLAVSMLDKVEQVSKERHPYETRQSALNMSLDTP